MLSRPHINACAVAVLAVMCSSASRTSAATAPATSSAAAAATTAVTSRPARGLAVDGIFVRATTKCEWGDLLGVALRGGKLEVESHPPPAIANDLANRRPVEVEVTNAADKQWRLQGVPHRPQIVIGGRVAGGAAPVPGAAAAPPPPPPPHAIDFVGSVRARPQAGEAPRLASIMLMQGTFRIGGRWVRDEKTLQIDFRSHADKTNVALSVRELGRRRAAAILSIEAGDVRQLRRERPADVRLYLEPLLRELCGGNNPLRPQAGDVYRVFDEIRADSASLERVKRIVESFDALEPAVREAASAELNGLGPSAVLAAARVERTDLSAEQAMRLDGFIARHSTLLDVSAARRDPMFLIDCLEDEDRAVRAAALKQLREVAAQEIDFDFDVDAPAAERAEAAAALASQLLDKPKQTSDRLRG